MPRWSRVSRRPSSRTCARISWAWTERFAPTPCAWPFKRFIEADLHVFDTRDRFTPKEAEVRVRGRVHLGGDTFVLVLPDSSDTFTLHASPSAREQLREAIGREVEAQGRVAEESERAGAARILEVKSVKTGRHDN